MTTDRFSFLRRPALPLAVGLAVVAALAWLVFAGGTAKRTEGERWVAVRAAGNDSITRTRFGRPKAVSSSWKVSALGVGADGKLTHPAD